MSRVHLFKESDGWRATIESAGHTVVVDGFFEDEIEAAHAAFAAQEQPRY
jgi:hypothetical protein